MKKLTSIAIAFLLVLSVVPAMAGDQTGSDRELVTPVVDQAPLSFQAFSKLPATERQDLVPLTDKELASIEGEGWVSISIGCQVSGFFCGNAAIIAQPNVALGGLVVSQGSIAASNQNFGIQVQK